MITIIVPSKYEFSFPRIDTSFAPSIIFSTMTLMFKENLSMI